MQNQEHGATKRIGYWPKTLTDEEKNLDTTHGERLVVIWAISPIRPYLKECRFILKIDHRALLWILNHTDATGKLVCFRLQLLV